MKNALPRQRHTVCLRLVMRIATKVSSSGGSIATVRPQPKRDFRRSSSPRPPRIAIASEDHLVCPSSSSLKVWRTLPGALLAGEELDVVDQQCIERAVAVLNSFIELCCSARTMSLTKRSECT